EVVPRIHFPSRTNLFWRNAIGATGFHAGHERLTIAATTTPPMPYRLLKLAEARWVTGTGIIEPCRPWLSWVGLHCLWGWAEGCRCRWYVWLPASPRRAVEPSGSARLGGPSPLFRGQNVWKRHHMREIEDTRTL